MPTRTSPAAVAALRDGVPDWVLDAAAEVAAGVDAAFAAGRAGMARSPESRDWQSSGNPSQAGEGVAKPIAHEKTGRGRRPLPARSPIPRVQNEKLSSTSAMLTSAGCVCTAPVLLVAWMLYLPAAAPSGDSGIGSAAW